MAAVEFCWRGCRHRHWQWYLATNTVLTSRENVQVPWLTDSRVKEKGAVVFIPGKSWCCSSILDDLVWWGVRSGVRVNDSGGLHRRS